MDALVFSLEEAQKINNAQIGQIRVSPVPLADERLFLTSDVLSEKKFADFLQNFQYETLGMSEIEPLLLPQEIE